MSFRDEGISPSQSTLHLPRILCLHGGGTNARIFYQQTRTLRSQLQPYFRLCFADAPFICQSAGPDVTTVYGDLKPFRRWLRWLDAHPAIERKTAVEEVEAAIEAAMAEDDARNATGDWVGILGFSQGAKVAASLLLRQQMRASQGTASRGNLATATFRFGVLMAGSAPLISLEPDGLVIPGLDDASQLSRFSLDSEEDPRKECLLHLPTIHVHGLRDPGLARHRQLLAQYCEEGERTRLVEWDGDHRIPIKRNDAAAVVKQILDVAAEIGCCRINR